MPDWLYDFQQYLTEWAVRLGRAAIFADCGLGKTPMQLVWAQNVVQHTNQPVLILAPLGVTGQTLYEAEKFGIKARRARPGVNGNAVIEVTNYEKLHLFEPDGYGGIVCDESSILKNFNGKRRQEITEFMRTIPYRLLCTATAAPNDWVELGTSSEALGYMGQRDMLTRFFSRKAHFARQRGKSKEWTLRPWAEDGPFWQWLSSWARTARMPSDLEYGDDGFILPPLNVNHIEVRARSLPPGVLFDVPAVTWHEEREVIRRTIRERCEAAAGSVEKNGRTSMVWVNLNDEGDLMERLIPGAVQVAGRDSDEKKEESARWFVRGSDERRILISKPTIFGFGLNFQHCAHMTYFP
ncbi:MAG: helicase, partial [Anaerolineae bacterium]|nr:helicase [Anaerolineae bacterium]